MLAMGALTVSAAFFVLGALPEAGKPLTSSLGALFGDAVQAAERERGSSETSESSADNSPPGGHDTDAFGVTSVQKQRSGEAAQNLCDAVIRHLTLGPPLEAKLRMRAWAAGEQILAVGSYQQAGQGTGWMRMELQSSIAEGQGIWQQSSDGRLAWTRETLGGDVQVRRVDVGRLREPLAAAAPTEVANWLRVGGLAEILDRIRTDYRLTLTKGKINEEEMWVLRGAMRESVLEPLVEARGGNVPQLVPQMVRVAIPAASIGNPLPARIEFWQEQGGTLLSLLEIYDANRTEMPSVNQFRFEPGGDDFLNETDAYMRRFGYVLAELQQ